MLLLILCVFFSGSSGFSPPYPRSRTLYFEGDAGEKALVTPLLQKGLIQEARDLTLVTGLNPEVLSYSGFFTVDETCNSNLYFWFFPSQNDWTTDPVSVWLQGGPGSTSFFGLLTENGPYNLRADGELELREYSWNRNSSVIYIDNPVGTGYSYTDDCYLSNQMQVGESLLNAIEQFFQLFPEISDNPFYLTGESYAGKYVPAFAYAIAQSNSTVNLQGLLIGNGLVDPENQQHYPSYLFQMGLIDRNLRDLLEERENFVREEIENGNFRLANDLQNQLFDDIYVATGYSSLYNYLFPTGEPEVNIDAFVTRADVRAALHVGNSTWNSGGMSYVFLSADIMKSVRPWLQELLERYRVLLYNGQLDIVVAYPLTMGYVQKLEWSGADEYKSATRNVWYVDDEVAGYSKSAKLLTEVLVRSAGHMVPTDQPKWAFDLYQKFIFNQTIGSK